MTTFKLEIVTPDGLVFDGQSEGIRVRTVSGDIEILAGHTDYFAPLDTGTAKLTVGDVPRFASASGGFISVSGGEVKLVLTTFEFADEIDLERARLAKERAEASLSAAKDERDIRIAKAKLARAVARINTAGLK